MTPATAYWSTANKNFKLFVPYLVSRYFIYTLSINFCLEFQHSKSTLAEILSDSLMRLKAACNDHKQLIDKQICLCMWN